MSRGTTAGTDPCRNDCCRLWVSGINIVSNSHPWWDSAWGSAHPHAWDLYSAGVHEILLQSSFRIMGSWEVWDGAAARPAGQCCMDIPGHTCREQLVFSGVQGCYCPAQVKSLPDPGDKSHSGLDFSVCAVAAIAAWLWKFCLFFFFFLVVYELR